MERVRLLVEGRVQGVGYRYSACAEARRLGISGWVRNRSDGRVELEAEGTREDVEQFLDWCRRGPAFAEVSRVDVLARENETPTHDGFTIQP
jgi:acylphosphatase